VFVIPGRNIKKIHVWTYKGRAQYCFRIYWIKTDRKMNQLLWHVTLIQVTVIISRFYVVSMLILCVYLFCWVCFKLYHMWNMIVQLLFSLYKNPGKPEPLYSGYRTSFLLFLNDFNTILPLKTGHLLSPKLFK